MSSDIVGWNGSNLDLALARPSAISNFLAASANCLWRISVVADSCIFFTIIERFLVNASLEGGGGNSEFALMKSVYNVLTCEISNCRSLEELRGTVSSKETFLLVESYVIGSTVVAILALNAWIMSAVGTCFVNIHKHPVMLKPCDD